MTTPTVSTLEIAAIDHVFEMGSGYVLDFSNRTFSMFFADLGIDVDHEFPGGSKANRLRDLLRASDPERVARVLESLLEHRGKRDGDESSPHLTKVRTLIARLRKTSVPMAPVIAAVEVLSLAYVHELETKTDQRMSSGDFEGAITVARTMLEEVLLELQRRLVEQPEDYKGDLPKLLKAVTKSLGIDEQRTDIDERFRQVARGLVGIVHGLAPIRNQMSDGHPRKHTPAPHHARVVVNAAKTVATFLIESYAFQRDKGRLQGGG